MKFIGSGFDYESDSLKLRRKLFTAVGGFSLHAAIAIPKHQKDKLKRRIVIQLG